MASKNLYDAKIMGGGWDINSTRYLATKCQMCQSRDSTILGDNGFRCLRRANNPP